MSQNDLETKVFTQNDRLVALSDTLVDGNRNSIDLTGSAITLLMKNANTGAVKVNYASASIDGDATDGNVSYPWTGATDLDTPGEYNYWWKRTKDGKTEHHPGDGPKRRLLVVAAP